MKGTINIHIPKERELQGVELWEHKSFQEQRKRKVGSGLLLFSLCVSLSVSFQKKWKGPKALGKIMFVSEAEAFKHLKFPSCAFLEDRASWQSSILSTKH